MSQPDTVADRQHEVSAPVRFYDNSHTQNGAHLREEHRGEE